MNSALFRVASQLVPDAGDGGGAGEINSAFSTIYALQRANSRPPFDSINPRARLAKADPVATDFDLAWEVLKGFGSPNFWG